MTKKLLLSAILFLTLQVNVFAGDVSKAHTYVNGEVLTAALLNASFDEIITEVNDIDGDQLASNIAIVTSAICRFSNKVAFTQADNLEYIDSLADGYLDLEATTGIRMRINATEQINLVDGILQPTTDNDIDLGAAAKEYKDLYIDGTANIDAIAGIGSFVASGNLDIGAYDFRVSTLTADSLTSGRVAFASTNGLLIDDGDLTFSTDTLTATKIGAFTAAGAIDYNNENQTNVDIDSGAIDGVTIGAASAPTVTDLGSVATADINGGTMDGVTVGAETLTGMLYVNDASDDMDGLGSQGVSGQILTSAGAGANPTWVTGRTFVVYDSDDTFTVPAGITRVYVTACASGGGGGGTTVAGANGAGGGAGGECIVWYPHTVIPAAELTVDINAGGAGGVGDNDGSVGGNTVFDTITLTGGAGGQCGSNGGAGGVGSGGWDGGDSGSASAGTAGDFTHPGGSGGAGTGDGFGGGGGGGTILGAGAVGVSSSANGNNGAANTGGGGSGAGDTAGTQTGGTGGSGRIILAY